MQISNDTLIQLRYNNRKKSMLVAYLLAICLGIFGAHRFYLEKTKTAIVQLVLTLTIFGILITIIWSIIDLFLIPNVVKNYNETVIQSLLTNLE